MAPIVRDYNARGGHLKTARLWAVQNRTPQAK
jgi:hypothetical protein